MINAGKKFNQLNTHSCAPPTIPFSPKKCVKALKNQHVKIIFFITGKKAKSIKQMKYEIGLFPNLPESRIFSQQPGRKCLTFHQNSSLTQVNRCPSFVQVPFRCKLSWNPLNKINSYKWRAMSPTLMTISWITKSGLLQTSCKSYWEEIRPSDSSNQELFCLQQK